MALNQKNSRPIVVDGQRYRWLVSPKNKSVIFVAVKEDVKGMKLEVEIETDIDRFWVEFPNVEDLNIRVLKPNDASKIIRNAIKEGWNPNSQGKIMSFKLSENEKLILK